MVDLDFSECIRFYDHLLHFFYWHSFLTRVDVAAHESTFWKRMKSDVAFSYHLQGTMSSRVFFIISRKFYHLHFGNRSHSSKLDQIKYEFSSHFLVIQKLHVSMVAVQHKMLSKLCCFFHRSKIRIKLLSKYSIVSVSKQVMRSFSISSCVYVTVDNVLHMSIFVVSNSQARKLAIEIQHLLSVFFYQSCKQCK